MDRAVVVAVCGALPMTAVPVGYAVGGPPGMLFEPSATLLTVGPLMLMLMPVLLMLSRSLPETG